MKAELTRIGNSRGIRIPKPLIEQCGLGPTVELSIENQRLIVSSKRTPPKGGQKHFVQQTPIPMNCFWKAFNRTSLMARSGGGNSDARSRRGLACVAGSRTWARNSENSSLPRRIADEMNQSLRTVIVAPMTTVHRPYPTRVSTRFQDKAGQVAFDQLRAVDRGRLVRKLGKISAVTADDASAVLLELFSRI